MIKIALNEMKNIVGQFNEYKIKSFSIENIDLFLLKNENQSNQSHFNFQLQKELMQLCFSNLSLYWVFIVLFMKF